MTCSNWCNHYWIAGHLTKATAKPGHKHSPNTSPSGSGVEGFLSTLTWLPTWREDPASVMQLVA